MIDPGAFEAVFRSTPDECAVLDDRGSVVAVNGAWAGFASSAGASPASSGVGSDYLGVCRRAARLGAPRATEAYEMVDAVLSHRQASGSVVYPCTLSTGVRWFRSEVFATSRVGVTGARHVDITGHFSAAAAVDIGGLVDSSTPVVSEAGVLLALRDVLDGPPRPSVVVVMTDLPPRPVTMSEVVVPGGAVVARLRSDRSEVLAADDVLVVVITANDHQSAMRDADSVISASFGRSAGTRRRWGLATRTAADDAVTLLARARRALVRSSSRDMDQSPMDAPAARSVALQRSAEELTEAVADYDRALIEGAPMATLVALDRAVEDAERACVSAALRYG